MNINLKSQSWLMLYTYIIANGLLYSFLFWQGFEINILQYVSPYDLLPSIMFILILPLLIVGIYFSIFALTIPYNEKIDNIFNQKHALAYKRIKFTFRLLIFSSVALYTIYSLLFKEGFDRQLSIVMIITYILIWPIQKRTTLFADKGKLRDLYIGTAIMLPLLLYMFSHHRVEAIKKGWYSYIVESDSDCLKSNGDKFRFISSIGDKAFAYSLRDNSLCVFKYNYLHLKAEHALGEPETKQLQPNTI